MIVEFTQEKQLRDFSFRFVQSFIFRKYLLDIVRVVTCLRVLSDDLLVSDTDFLDEVLATAFTDIIHYASQYTENSG